MLTPKEQRFASKVADFAEFSDFHENVARRNWWEA
jgi:hypothetical protein